MKFNYRRSEEWSADEQQYLHYKCREKITDTQNINCFDIQLHKITSRVHSSAHLHESWAGS